MNQKIKFGKPTTITVPANNSGDDGRKYDVMANVTVDNGVVSQISEGQVLRCDASVDHPASSVADFQKMPGYENISIHGTVTAEERTAIREAIDLFIAEIEASDIDINN